MGILKILTNFNLLLIVRTINCTNTDLNILQQEMLKYHNTTAMKADFAYEVVGKIFHGFQQWYYTVTFCDFTYFENKILKYIETQGDGYSVILINGCPDSNKTRAKPKVDKHGQTAYLVTSSELNLDSSNFAIEAFERTGVFKPRSTVIFIINERVETDNYFYYTLKLHFELLWSRSITNSVLILRSDELKMYTYNPFLNEILDVTHIENLDDMLSEQYHNLYGYKLRLSVFREIYMSNKTGPVLCDSNLVHTVMSSLNATCLPLAPRDGDTVGDIFENGTITGVTADLIDGYTDLELNSRILKNRYYGYIDNTYPFHQDVLCFLVKKFDIQSTFTTAIALISLPLFIIFFSIVIFFILLTIKVRIAESKLLKLENKQSVGTVAVDLIKCFIRQTVDIKFWGPVFRFLTMIILLYSLIIDCVIDGIIISAIQNPRFKPDLNSMADLVESNLTLGIHDRDLNLFLKSLNSQYLKALENRIEILNDKKIKQVIEQRNYQYAILLRKSDAVYLSKSLANLHNGRSLFHVMEDCPVPCSIVYGLRYGSPYLVRINNILHHLNQGGILDFWSETDEYSLQRKILTNVKDKKALDIGTLQELFFILLIGIFISIVIFTMEILLNYYQKRTKILTKIGK